MHALWSTWLHNALTIWITVPSFAFSFAKVLEDTKRVAKGVHSLAQAWHAVSINTTLTQHPESANLFSSTATSWLTNEKIDSPFNLWLAPEKLGGGDWRTETFPPLPLFFNRSIITSSRLIDGHRCPILRQPLLLSFKHREYIPRQTRVTSLRSLAETNS